MDARARLLVLDGPEGAGKTSQLERLAAWFSAHGVPCAALREPGGTATGDEIRRLLLRPEGVIAPRAEALLFMASRAQLVSEVIAPLRDRGVLVLLDRFFLSTYAYQVAGRGLDEADVRAANRLATAGTVPDLTLLLAVDARVRAARRAERGVADRLEREDAAFHARVDHAFDDFLSPAWQRAHPECGPIVRVEGSGTPDQVFERVLQVLASRWPELVPALQGVRA